jgi:teichuronic acid biosynthesis glycosyltransferase TuaH
MDIVMFALARWDGPYSSTAFSLAKEFSRSNRVFYVENPITIKYFIRNVFKKHVWRKINTLLFGISPYTMPYIQNPNLIIVTSQITIPINFLAYGFFYEKLSSINDFILSKTLKKLINNYSINKFIFFNCFNPFYVRKFPKGFNPLLFIYMTVDDIRHSTHIKKHGPWLEKEMMKKADLVFATSIELTLIARRHSKKAFHLPNAADISLFKTSQESLIKPEELNNLTMPIVIYTGNIDHRIDFDLLNELVKRSPEITFVLVGPIAIDEYQIQVFREYSNVLFTGKKNLIELPSFLKYAHCAIIPFKCNALTKSIYPLKINEYLATGKPVVATPFSNDIQSFDKVISISNNPLTFSTAIYESIQSDSPLRMEERLRFVENNTWKSRVDSFWEYINQNLDKN